MLGYDYEIIYKKGHENIIEMCYHANFRKKAPCSQSPFPFQNVLKRLARNGFHIPGSPNSLTNCRWIPIPQRATLGKMRFFATRKKL